MRRFSFSPDKKSLQEIDLRMVRQIESGSNISRQALSLMSRLFYLKLGEEAIPIIREVWYEMGLASGDRLKAKLKEHTFEAAAKAMGGQSGEETVREMIKNTFHVRTKEGTPCDVGLENAGSSLCKAVMSINQGQFKAICGKDIVMEIPKSRAAGDNYCEIFYQDNT